MPIANCIITSKCQLNLDQSKNLIEIWANESKISPEQMTVNIVVSNEQHGKKYNIMANLLLASMWSYNDISSLQVGLAKALAQFFNVSLKSIHVTTSIINSGMVVEDGNVIEW